MRPIPSVRSPRCGTRLTAAAVGAGLALTLMAAGAPAAAEQADRYKPLNVEADQQSRIDVANRVVTFSGNVVVTKGTMTLRADRVEVRETPDGFHQATATGRPAVFRQKRDGVDEFVEGEAQKLDYDARADTVRLSGEAVVRRLRGTVVAEEVSGALITYNNATEVFEVSGGGDAQAAGGRVRAVLTPRQPGPAASAAAPPAPVPGERR
jgi:lipopolysaccharide export system protein LptA